jgi:hypothetical protein
VARAFSVAIGIVGGTGESVKVGLGVCVGVSVAGMVLLMIGFKVAVFEAALVFWVGGDAQPKRVSKRKITYKDGFID